MCSTVCHHHQHALRQPTHEACGRWPKSMVKPPYPTPITSWFIPRNIENCRFDRYFSFISLKSVYLSTSIRTNSPLLYTPTQALAIYKQIADPSKNPSLIKNKNGWTAHALKLRNLANGNMWVSKDGSAKTDMYWNGGCRQPFSWTCSSKRSGVISVTELGAGKICCWKIFSFSGISTDWPFWLQVLGLCIPAGPDYHPVPSKILWEERKGRKETRVGQ